MVDTQDSMTRLATTDVHECQEAAVRAEAGAAVQTQR